MSTKKKSDESSNIAETADNIKNALLEKAEIRKKHYARTGCTLLDLVIGGGEGLGIPYGKIINIIGDKSSGKTFVSNEIIARNFHDFGKQFTWNYDDSESGYTFDTDSLYGFPIVTKDSMTSKTVEEFDVHVGEFLDDIKKDQRAIYVVDSLDGLSNDDIEKRAIERKNAYQKGKKFKEGTYGMKTPKFLSQEFFRTKTSQVEETNAILIIVSQVRQNIDPTSFKKFDRNGGKALDFYAHTCLWLANVTKIKKTVDGEVRVIGVLVKAKADKSKTPRPYRECTFSIYFDYGIDDIGSNLDYLFDLRDDTGKLRDIAQSFSLFMSKPKNLENLKTFLEGKNLLEDARDDRKKETGDKTLALKWLRKWIEDRPELKEEMDKEFGETRSRDEWIHIIESDPEMKSKIERMVVDKWEKIEQSMSTNRSKKYQ